MEFTPQFQMSFHRLEWPFIQYLSYNYLIINIKQDDGLQLFDSA